MSTLKYLQEKFFALPTTKKLVVVFPALALVLVTVWAGYQFGFRKGENLDQITSPIGNLISGKPEEPVNFPNPITGVLFKKSEAAAWVNRLPLAVIVENHTDARPQSGLSKADVVYEALAEGGITRFLAVFLQEDTSIGPVRSNRPYFIDWLSEYDAAYAHVGGSPEGQYRVKAYGIKDLDQFAIGAPTYERVSSRFAPHNVYTTTEKLRQAAEGRGYKKGANIVPWKFADTEPLIDARPAAFSLKLSFLGTYGYDVRWDYNRINNSYLRFNAGAAQTDAVNGAQIEVKTIALEVVSHSNDPSGHSRLFMDTTAGGVAKVFTNGVVTDGTWKKESRTSRTQFFDSTGQEIKFNRGKIWVEIVPPESAITY